MTSLSAKTVSSFALAVVLLAGAGSVDAQDRADRWELGLAVIYQLGTDLDFERGSTVQTSDDFGFVIDGGYNFTDNLAVNFGFEWAGVGYNADGIDDQGETIGIRGSYDAFSLFSNLVYYIGDGALAPYVGAGIGWTWIDTNVPNGPPATGCWWDPWWGWVCYTTYPTETTDAFSYQAILGARYEFNFSSYLRLAYTSQWINLSNASGTPRFDVISAEFGWMF
jgi:opacity protein-like surface antigen